VKEKHYTMINKTDKFKRTGIKRRFIMVPEERHMPAYGTRREAYAGRPLGRHILISQTLCLRQTRVLTWSSWVILLWAHGLDDAWLLSLLCSLLEECRRMRSLASPLQSTLDMLSGLANWTTTHRSSISNKKIMEKDVACALNKWITNIINLDGIYGRSRI
jgi:hypothetical protein